MISQPFTLFTAMKFLSLIATLSALVFPQAARAQDKPAETPAKAATAAPLASLELLRDPAVVDLFRSLPVQESGRIKPLDTAANSRLKRFFGKQSIYVTDSGMSDGEALKDPATGKPIVSDKGKTIRIGGMEWLLISWYRPDIAHDFRVFVVDDSDAVAELGLDSKGKRDRYSLNELAQGRDQLMQKMQELRNIDSKDRTPVQRALGKLALDYLEYEMIVSHLDFMRAPFGAAVNELPPELAAHVKDGRADWSKLLPAMGAHFKAHPEAAAPMANPWLRAFYPAIFGALMSGNEETMPRFFPPPADKPGAWSSPGTIIQTALQGGEVSDAEYKMMAEYGGLLGAVNDTAAFKAKLTTYHDEVIKAAAARNEAGHVALEVGLNKADYFYNALYCFVTALLILSISWIKPAAGWALWCRRACTLLLVAGCALGTIGIVIRCLIMERPPITTLYETIIFITTACVLFALLAEWATRSGFGIAVAAIAGTAGMFLSIRFDAMEGRDTLVVLEAVLITNFWLATHVPCINLGYAVGMLAAIFFGQLCGAAASWRHSPARCGGQGFDPHVLRLCLRRTAAVPGGHRARAASGRIIAGAASGAGIPRKMALL